MVNLTSRLSKTLKKNKKINNIFQIGIEKVHFRIFIVKVSFSLFIDSIIEDHIKKNQLWIKREEL